jgi:ferredoxin-NADP reductase
VVSAEHSYVAGNAYKGIHVLVHHGDERPHKIYFHSELSQAVKDQNHVNYEVERDRKTGTPSGRRLTSG